MQDSIKNTFSFYLRTHFEEIWSKSDSIFQNRAIERDWSPLHAPNGDKPYLSSLLRYKDFGGIQVSFHNEAHNISEIIIFLPLWNETGISKKSISPLPWPIQPKSEFVSGSIGMVGAYSKRRFSISSAIAKKSMILCSVFEFGHFKDSSIDFKINFL